MEQHIPQEEIRRIIISDMVKKRNVFAKPNVDMLACMTDYYFKGKIQDMFFFKITGLLLKLLP